MKKILIIGMVDSVHTARWVERIKNGEYEIHIFPSRVHRKIHPELLELINKNPKIRLIGLFPNHRISPFLDFILRKMKFNSFNLLISLLKTFLRKTEYSCIHALEIQHAGYLVIEIKSEISASTKIICTNWGSDIYYFRQFADHLVKIKKILLVSDYYSAECARDYVLAKELGFNGQDLPLVPNSFKLNEIENHDLAIWARNQIIAKCYGEVFGLGEIVINVLKLYLKENEIASAFLYSVTDDLLTQAKNLAMMFPTRVHFSTIRHPLSSKQMAFEFQRSRIYLGASRSDGISTSFLEAMNYGVFPIQTNTSCAEEWINQGCIGLAVPPNEKAILSALRSTFADEKLIKRAAFTNLEILKDITDPERLQRISESFYD